MTSLWTDMKRDLKWVLPIAAALLVVGFCAPADAQTTQPVYIRPSKGQTIEIITNAKSTPSTGVTVTSPVLDMTGFGGLAIVATPNLGMPPCFNTTPRWEGSLSKSGPFSSGLIRDAALQGFLLPINVPYVRLVLTIPAGGCDPGVSYSVTPTPFSDLSRVQGSYLANELFSGQTTGTLGLRPNLIGGVSGGCAGGVCSGFVSVIAVSEAGAVSVSPLKKSAVSVVTTASVNNTAAIKLAASAARCSTTVINTDTTAAYCGTSAATATSTTGIPLNPATGSNLAGGSFTFPVTDAIYCATAAGTTTVRFSSIFANALSQCP